MRVESAKQNNSLDEDNEICNTTGHRGIAANTSSIFFARLGVVYIVKFVEGAELVMQDCINSFRIQTFDTFPE